jgi:hypothetical protein
MNERQAGEELRALYPTLSPEELQYACERLDEYLLLAWEIWETREVQSLPVDPPLLPR